MKKMILFCASAFVFAVLLSSCRSSGPHCQAYGKIDVVKKDKSERAL